MSATAAAEPAAAHVAGHVQAISACLAWRGRLFVTVIAASVALVIVGTIDKSDSHPALWATGAALAFIATWIERRLAAIAARFANALSAAEPSDPAAPELASPWLFLAEGGDRRWGDQHPASLAFLLPLTYALILVAYVAALIFQV